MTPKSLLCAVSTVVSIFPANGEKVKASNPISDIQNSADSFVEPISPSL